jgi:hypothetical protein
MMISYPRFECRLEDSGTWMVWDNVKSEEAQLAGSILQGRARHVANAACAILTRIHLARIADLASRQKRLAALLPVEVVE